MVMCRNQTGGRWNYDLAVGEVADGTHVAYGLFKHISSTKQSSVGAVWIVSRPSTLVQGVN